MAEKSKSDIGPQKRSLKLSPALGDWTSYRPTRSLIKRIKVGLYGFDRLSDDDLKEAHIMHYRFGENLLRNLKINFKIGGEIFAVDALQTTYGNFIKNITGPLLQGKVDVPEFHEEILMCLDMAMVSTLINSSLGMKDTKNLGGELTGAEKLVIENSFIEHLDSSLSASFRDSLPGAHFEVVSSPDLTPNPYIASSSTFVYFSVEISVGDSLGKIIIGYSGQLLKGMLKKIKILEKPRPLSLNRVKANVLTKTSIPVTVVLGTTELKGSEIYQLEVGDVVSLDNSIHNAIQIRIAESGTVVLAQPGTSNGKMIARVVGVEKEKDIKVAPPLPVAPPVIEPLEPEEVEAAALEEPSAAEYQEGPSEELPEEELTEADLAGEELPVEETPTEGLGEEGFGEDNALTETAEEEAVSEPEEDFGLTDEDFANEDLGLDEETPQGENKEEI